MDALVKSLDASALCYSLLLVQLSCWLQGTGLRFLIVICAVGIFSLLKKMLD